MFILFIVKVHCYACIRMRQLIPLNDSFKTYFPGINSILRFIWTFIRFPLKINISPSRGYFWTQIIFLIIRPPAKFIFCVKNVGKLTSIYSRRVGAKTINETNETVDTLKVYTIQKKDDMQLWSWWHGYIHVDLSKRQMKIYDVVNFMIDGRDASCAVCQTHSAISLVGVICMKMNFMYNWRFD